MTARHATFAAVTCAAALAVAGCGKSADKPGPGIPRATVAALDSRLTELDDRVAVRIPGACNDARTEDIPAIRSAVSGLPRDTDPDIRSALERSVRRLEQLFASECRAIAAETAPTDTTTTTTTETVTPPPQTIQTDTAPPPATQTTPTPTTTTPVKPKKPKKNGNTGNGGSTPSVGGGAGSGG